MAKEKFILVSLKDEESKKLAQIVTNDTSRKILDYLADNEATESDLAKKLDVPISTVHYNLQALVKSKMVEADEYHYSEKGKEVLHYKLANKYIIIAPKSTYGIKERLKSILPVALLGVAATAILSVWNKGLNFFSKTSNVIQEASVQKVALDYAEDEMARAVPAAHETAGATANQVIAEPSFWQTFISTPALWFLVGCVFTLTLIIIGEYIHYKRNN